MKNYFTTGKLSLNEAIKESVLKIIAGQTGIYLNTEFGTIIISVERRSVGDYNKRVCIYTPKNAPLSDRIVRSNIQEGFDFYIVISFGKGVHISYKYEEIITHLVAQGLCYAFIKRVFFKLKIKDTLLDNIEASYYGDLYCDSFYMSSSYEMACQYILTDMPPAATYMHKQVINSNIHLTEEIFKKRKSEIRCILQNVIYNDVSKVLWKVSDTGNLNQFWILFISHIMILCGINNKFIIKSYEYAKNKSNETDIGMLICWIRDIKYKETQKI